MARRGSANKFDAASRCRKIWEIPVSISTEGLGSVRPAGGLRPIPAAARIDTALRDRERQFVAPFDELLEALPTAVYTTDAEGRITFFNEAAADLWGRRPELGKRVVRLLAAVLAPRQTDAAR